MCYSYDTHKQTLETTLYFWDLKFCISFKAIIIFLSAFVEWLLYFSKTLACWINKPIKRKDKKQNIQLIISMMTNSEMKTTTKCEEVACIFFSSSKVNCTWIDFYSHFRAANYKIKFVNNWRIITNTGIQSAYNYNMCVSIAFIYTAYVNSCIRFNVYMSTVRCQCFFSLTLRCSFAQCW